MSDSSPPPIATESPTGSRFAGVAAMSSLLAPFVVFFLYILVFAYFRAHGGMERTSMMVLALFPLVVSFGGIVLGIVALALTKRLERKGMFGVALAGLCLNGLLLALMVVVPVLLPLDLGKDHPATAAGRLDKALKTLTSASDEGHRFYALNDAAKQSFEVGRIEDARKYAADLLALAPRFQGNWNYGSAIQDGNLVLGRIAVREGRIPEAKEFLLTAGKSPGSPQMDSFGPNMSLAKDLLEKGERETVLQYLELCRKFWKMDFGRLDDWSREVKAGRIPQFGANLVY